jgi:hypothetical protein
MMVVGMYSGKEFVVEDKAFTLLNEVNGERKQVFLQKDRVITVKYEAIEYWNEIRTDDYVSRIAALVGKQMPVDPNTHGVDVT